MERPSQSSYEEAVEARGNKALKIIIVGFSLYYYSTCN